MKYCQELSKSDLQAVEIVEMFAMEVNGDFILPYLLQWVMIYSFGIIPNLEIDHKLIPYPELQKVHPLYEVSDKARYWCLSCDVYFRINMHVF